ncbi:hypothetical protein SAMD00019534_030620 [Acytostelium subglobosum LB1]|uniref:hypothetical protein n=1 Tax=Acytostelium subglobosum LB1 TaxID=1410327 RepID=UPI0006449D97|nr:hypothetical protein SAMD00019534_030620 [Acytostelium subglobosum LB1]GAM19887.1 hypothetical protein SAMD00019534_030620 [Acytostelium subglobosum LB1]|eukprot:XP_012756649.1 hypothetical protein SAMD00019534_030620 [Acytostelium subglobosum LB1]
MATVASMVRADGPTNMFELNGDNVDSYVVGKGTWMLAFYAPWCPYSQELEPVFNYVAEVLNGELNFARLDCVADPSLISRFNIEAYPTIKVYRDGILYQYVEDRTIDKMITFVRKGLPTNVYATYPLPKSELETQPSSKPSEMPPPIQEGVEVKNNVSTNPLDIQVTEILDKLYDLKNVRFLYILIGGVITSLTCGAVMKRRLFKSLLFHLWGRVSIADL